MKALKFRRISCYSDKSISRSKCATINNNNKTLLSFTNSKHCLVLRIRRSIREKCSTLGGLGCKLTNNRTKRIVTNAPTRQENPETMNITASVLYQQTEWLNDSP